MAKLMESYIQQKRVLKGYQVELPQEQESIRFDYGFRNGKANLVRPIDFKSDGLGEVLKVLSAWAAKGRLLQHRREEDHLLWLVLGLPDEKNQLLLNLAREQVYECGNVRIVLPEDGQLAELVAESHLPPSGDIFSPN